MSNTVVIIGDSLTYGKWDNGSPTKNLTNRLSEKYPRIRFVNLGINGDGLANMNSRKGTADAYEPFRVIVWGGINDVAGEVSLCTMIENLETIYAYYAGKGYEVWAMTVTPRDDNSSENLIARDALNSWIMTTADVDRVIDTFSIIADPMDTDIRLAAYADSFTPNHLTDAGYGAIVASI